MLHLGTIRNMRRTAPWKKELPLSVQYATLVALWGAWLMSVAWVKLKDRANTAQFMVFADYEFIYQLIYFGMPLALGSSGIYFLARIGRPGKLSIGHRLFYFVVAGLTIFAAVVLLTGGFWAWSLVEVRY
jgi:hypothetical protein